MAARAHDVAAIALRGRTACLNFADSAWRLPVPTSSEAKDIQKAAAEVAEAFKPSETKDIQKAAAEAAEAFRPSKNDNVAESTSSETLMELQHYRHAAYMDEEAIFETPEYGYNIIDMLRTWMLPPPQFLQSERNDDTKAVTDPSLWGYESDLPIPK